MIGVPARSPPTRPPFARNSVMTRSVTSLDMIELRSRQTVVQFDPTGRGVLDVEEFQVLPPGDPVKKPGACSNGDRVHDQAKLVQEPLVDQAFDQAGTTDDVDGSPAPRLERAEFVEVAGDPCP